MIRNLFNQSLAPTLSEKQTLYFAEMKRWLLISIPFLLLTLGLFQADLAHLGNLSYKVGDPVDSLHGVKVYYNGSVSNVTGRHLTEDGYNLGLKYQCVEFVKRYYYQHYQHQMPDSWGHAKDFFTPGIADGERNSRRDLLQFSNPGSSKPAVGDLLVMDGTIFNKYGHVAIISAVGEDFIEIIQQNPGPTAPSRIKLKLEETDANWRIENGSVLGWLRKE